MKLALSSSHRDFFNKNRYLELDGLLKNTTLQSLKNDLEAGISERVKAPYRQQTTSKIFLEGHDLWRSHPVLKKYVTQNIWAELASELVSYRPLRLGFDQFFLGGESANQGESFSLLKQKKFTLEEYSCVNEVLCGLMICLNAPDSIDDTTENIFSKIAGNGIYFGKDFSIDFSVLTHLPKAQYLMIVYVQQNSVYTLNENDPFTHFLKHLGYVFGDKLNDKLNPIVLR